MDIGDSYPQAASTLLECLRDIGFPSHMLVWASREQMTLDGEDRTYTLERLFNLPLSQGDEYTFEVVCRLKSTEVGSWVQEFSFSIIPLDYPNCTMTTDEEFAVFVEVLSGPRPTRSKIRNAILQHRRVNPVVINTHLRQDSL